MRTIDHSLIAKANKLADVASGWSQHKILTYITAYMNSTTRDNEDGLFDDTFDFAETFLRKLINTPTTEAKKIRALEDEDRKAELERRAIERLRSWGVKVYEGD